MFGECIGVWFLNEWMKMGEPKDFQLVELGPGKGTLASDILRTVARVRPEALQGLSVHLVEVSSKMRQLQEATLCGHSHGEGGQEQSHVSKFGPKVAWYQTLRDVPKQFSFFLAHEFFDALAVNKFERTKDGWREVLIDIDPTASEGTKLRYVISRNATPACVLLEQSGVMDLMVGREKVELCTLGGTLVREISQRVVEQGGLGLIADYGHLGEDGDTFR
jgi:NADH dehydrogenase [ubiquinone] 1 alpha subcomplex assembly factor 7